MNTPSPAPTVLVVESSIPADMTIGEYRRSRPAKATRWQRVRKAVAR